MKYKKLCPTAHNKNGEICAETKILVFLEN